MLKEYQSLDNIDVVFLYSKKIFIVRKLLFLLKDLFKKDNLSNIFVEFLRPIERNRCADVPEFMLKLLKRNYQKVFKD